MPILDRDRLKGLMHASGDEPFVSLYLPTHRAGPEIRQDPIRLKNLLNEAREQLAQRGFRKPKIDTVLRPAAELVDDTEFWRHQDRGLAMFLANGGLLKYQLPMEVEALCFVGDRLFLNPLLPLLHGDGRFYILALAAESIRVFEATRDTIEQIETPSVPDNIRDALGEELVGHSLQFHTGAQQGLGRRAVYHGQGAGEDDVEPDLRRFCHLVDKGLRADLPNHDIPMVVAAVERLLGLFHQMAHYPTLVESGISGSPVQLGTAELKEKAWPLVRERFEQTRNQEAERFKTLSGHGQASTRVRDVVLSAQEGRISTLFVAIDDHCWGRFDPDSREVTIHDSPRLGDEDLLERAATLSFLNGATVYAGPRSKVPGRGAIAAVLRY